MTANTVKQWLSTISTVLLVLCALVVTGLVVRRELFRPTDRLEMSFYEDWKELTTAGNRLGDPGAPVQMVVFYDYQCPFCRSAAPTIEQLRAKYQDRIAITFRHFLLESIHPQARAAALAAECAADQGRFEVMHHVLFDNATRLGNVPWERLAEEAGVPDIQTFTNCFVDGRHSDRIARDRMAVAMLGISSVPGFVINGTVVTGAKPFEVLDGLVQAALDEAA